MIASDTYWLAGARWGSASRQSVRSLTHRQMLANTAGEAGSGHRMDRFTADALQWWVDRAIMTPDPPIGGPS